MKKFLSLILLAFVTVMASAQDATVTTEVGFDFTKPESLTPKPDFKGATAIPVIDVTFKNKAISLSFGNSGSTSLPQYYDEGYLYIHRGENMFVSCPNDYEILKIEFSSQTIIGGITLSPGQKGTMNRSSYPITWTNTDANGNYIEGIHMVSFYNSNEHAKVYGLTVTYRSPLDVLVTETITPEKGSTVEAFDAMTLTFDHEIASTAKQFQLTDGTGTVAYLTPAVSGKTVTLTPSAALTQAEIYSVTFPKNSFVSTEGYYNKAFSTNFTYVLPKNTFNPESITPAEGSVEEMPETIELVFPDVIGNRTKPDGDDEKDISKILCDVINAKTGSVAGVATGSLKEGTDNTLVLTVKNMDRTARGIYTITVPEERVYNIYYNTASANLRYNSEFTLTYKVAGADAPSEAVLAEAKALLAKTGVGYPKADAAERTALKAAVDAEDKSDEDYLVLIDEFVTSTDIDLPAAGKYYTIANVQKNGKKYYLAYDGEAVTLTSDAANAYSFKASATAETNAVNVRTFSTADGKYLHTLVATTNYSEVTPSNVTSEEKTVSSLSLVKMPSQNNVDVDRLMFGTIAMSGLIGKKYGQGEDITAYSNVLSSGNIAEGETLPYFLENLSGAFFFAEAEAPKIITKYEVTVNPASETGVVEALESIVVTFPEVTAITLADASKISLKGMKTNVVVPVEGEPVVEGNKVTVKFGNLANDTYTFTAAEGAFTYEKDAETITVQEITTSFTVYYEDEFVYDLDDEPNLVILDNNWGNNKVNLRELNNLTIQLKDGQQNSIETFLNPNAEVDLIYNRVNPVAKGKFEKFTTTETYTEDVFIRNGVEMGVVKLHSGTTVVLVDDTKYTDYGQYPGDEIVEKERTKYYYHMKLKLNKEMNEQTAKDGLYWFNIPEETFGDAMYNSWLNGASVAKHDCHVNRYFQIAVETDKNATAITDVNADSMTNDVIFDISGRRVKNAAAPGLYIINGKKHIVK